MQKNIQRGFLSASSFGSEAGHPVFALSRDFTIMTVLNGNSIRRYSVEEPELRRQRQASRVSWGRQNLHEDRLFPQRHLRDGHHAGRRPLIWQDSDYDRVGNSRRDGVRGSLRRSVLEGQPDRPAARPPREHRPGSQCCSHPHLANSPVTQIVSHQNAILGGWGANSLSSQRLHPMTGAVTLIQELDTAPGFATPIFHERLFSRPSHPSSCSSTAQRTPTWKPVLQSSAPGKCPGSTFQSVFRLAPSIFNRARFSAVTATSTWRNGLSFRFHSKQWRDCSGIC